MWFIQNCWLNFLVKKKLSNRHAWICSLLTNRKSMLLYHLVLFQLVLLSVVYMYLKAVAVSLTLFHFKFMLMESATSFLLKLLLFCLRTTLRSSQLCRILYQQRVLTGLFIHATSSWSDHWQLSSLYPVPIQVSLRTVVLHIADADK